MRYNKTTILSKLFAMVWQNTKSAQFRVLLGISLVIGGSLLNLTLPLFLKLIVESFSYPNLFQLVTLLLVSYGTIWLCSRLLIDIRQIIVYRVFTKGIHTFTSEIFQKLLNLPMSYHVSNTTGSIMNSIERAQMSIPNILYGLIFIVLPMVVEVVIATGVLWYWYGIVIASIVFLIFSIYFLFTWYSIPYIVKAQRNSNKSSQKVSDYITDVLMNIEGIFYQSAQLPVLGECEQRMLDRENTLTKELVVTDMISIGQSIIAGIGFVSIILIIGFAVVRNELKASDFVLINGYLIQFLVPLSIIGITILRNIRDGFTKMEDVLKLLDGEEISDKISAKKITQAPVDISFRGVAFTYPDKKDYVLKDISFCLPEGKTLAIVGANGSGKSTITKLLYRLFDVTEGEILVQGINIKDIRVLELRKLIGVVPQEISLLNDSIYSNLTFGLENEVSPDDFHRVMSVTNIEELVNRLPDRYETVVGEQGMKLSGGEKKRIGIARALLRSPRILVLDEITSSLDNNTEYQVLVHLYESYKDLTKIIITHDPGYLFDMDNVIYLKNGKVYFHRKHYDLLATCEEYRTLWKRKNLNNYTDKK